MLIQLVCVAAVVVSVLALPACSVELSDHPEYGQVCAADAESYRGYCLALDAASVGEGGRDPAPASTDATQPEPAPIDAAQPVPIAAADAAACGLPEGCGPDGGTAMNACSKVSDVELAACNGIDEDCDGLSDEGVELACYDSAHGCMPDAAGGYLCTGHCRAGVLRCVAGSPGACEGQVAPQTEVCSGPDVLASDEDCDGRIDEGCACAQPTQACYGGPEVTRDVAPCRSGVQTCTGGGLSPCAGEVRPQGESCANPNRDDDCDGTPDDVPGLLATCTAPGVEGRCATGRMGCEGDQLRCRPQAPRAESCDGADDDCDGLVDEVFDLQADPANCGRCGRGCAAGQSCCDGACVDLDESADHCGACGNACGAGSSCCGGECHNLDSDQNHCGRCDNACGLLEGCCRTACRLLSLGC